MLNSTNSFVTVVLMKPITFNNINGFADETISYQRIYATDHLLKLFRHCGQETFINTVEMYALKSSRILKHRKGMTEKCEQEQVRLKLCAG
jgi:hypothetical protein